jgi:LacI family transcriptional regulator
VLTDNRGGIAQAFQHLTDRGHRRIGYIGDDERIYTGHERAAAFRECLRAQGGPVDAVVHPGPIEPARIAAALASLAAGDDPATAIITGNAATTIAGTTALVGFDDFPLADLLRPGLTVVAQGEAEIGRTTIDLLRSRLADPSRSIQTVTVPTTLIPRGSGELPA